MPNLIGYLAPFLGFHFFMKSEPLVSLASILISNTFIGRFPIKLRKMTLVYLFKFRICLTESESPYLKSNER
ncbi:MAG: hypothetical protein ACI8ZX_001624 [Planctomycetota bacterium]|jgi:hypothetical protein